MAQVTCVDFPEIDLTSGDSIRRWVREARPSIVINAAAYTAVDKAESEPDKAMQINGVAPGILAEEAKKLGALLVHYSTDYIFDGDQDRAVRGNRRAESAGRLWPLEAGGR